MRTLVDRRPSPDPVSAGELRDALERGELVAFFQPQIDVVSEVVLGVEALVRRQHPRRGLLAPAAFLQDAGRHGLLRPLTEHMLRTSLEALKRFRRNGHDLAVAVNVGPETLASPDFVTTVADLLAELDVAAPRLRLEVTERAVMESGDDAIEALGRLRSLGLGVSLDDFGTGFSSLARLRLLPIDEVKIDRSFVADMRSHGDMTAGHALPHAGLVAQLPVASAFYQPIHRGARVVGVLALAWKRPLHSLCPVTRMAVELVADAAAMALGRPDAESGPRFTADRP